MADWYPALAALESAPPSALPPLALKMCAGCTAQYAVEGDVGDEQGGTTWFGPCCPTPARYADVFSILPPPFPVPAVKALEQANAEAAVFLKDLKKAMTP